MSPTLSQNYPTAVSPDVQPWLQFDPKTQPDQYLNAVLSYFFEGNIQADSESSFDPTLNAVRGWYNAPWQDVGIINGREFIHGLTRERVSRPHELAPEQVHEWNNYAVGFYNAPGGMIFGRGRIMAILIQQLPCFRMGRSPPSSYLQRHRKRRCHT